jgi:hypothetical protein
MQDICCFVVSFRYFHYLALTTNPLSKSLGFFQISRTSFPRGEKSKTLSNAKQAASSISPTPKNPTRSRPVSQLSWPKFSMQELKRQKLICLT